MQTKLSWTALTTILIVISSQALSAADLKIGIVNMSDLMKGYDKAQRAELQLKEQADDYRAAQEEKRAEIQRLGEAYREALAAVDDAALSDTAKADKKDVAIGHLTKLKEAELDYRQFAREAERQLAAESRRMRQTLVEDLRLKVQEHARNQGYGLVIDAVTIIYAVPGEVDDLTEAIAAALGAGE
ncbi:MAG: OmpH family outer membrane protein [Verrucomicrobia bacterium]|nr:OmpH family outer membrane protein [Verrucomicrobiota bacterium]MDA1087957.1 OmpH family outer membrane protein [Verrucomicrobiota bacterium]